VSARRKAALTPLGKALRGHAANQHSGWERDYSAAIEAARAGDVARLAYLLRAHRPLTDADFDGLADYVEATAKRGRGRDRNAAVHDAWRSFRAFMDSVDTRRLPKPERDKMRERCLAIACKQAKREHGVTVDPEQVRDLDRRPKKRRA
jgi:hypothetical protein